MPGSGTFADKMLQGCLSAYQDAYRYRVGANANQLPFNVAMCPVHNYQRDGAMAGMYPVHGDMTVEGSGVIFTQMTRSILVHLFLTHQLQSLLCRY